VSVMDHEDREGLGSLYLGLDRYRLLCAMVELTLGG